MRFGHAMAATATAATATAIAMLGACSTAPDVAPAITDTPRPTAIAATAPAAARTDDRPASTASPLATEPIASPTSSPESSPTAEPAAPGSPPATPSPAASEPPAPPASAYTFVEYDVPRGSHPHDVAPAPDGTVWYTAQGSGHLGRLDPVTGAVEEVPLGRGSAPHGVVVGPDDGAWVTDGGLNAIVRIDPQTLDVTTYTLPGNRGVNLNTAAFDGQGTLWFTGQGGIYGRLTPSSGELEVFDAPRGRGPYGIAATPEGEVWFVSLAGSYLARIDPETAEATVLEPPTPHQGARRVWPDSQGRLWISEWNAAQVGMYDHATDEWREWQLPGSDSQPYSVYVDELDLVWLTDFGANSIVRFDPATETFDSFPIPSRNAAVRQQLGRQGELWGAESGTDKLVVLRRSED